MGFWGFIEVVRLALEIYKSLKGKSKGEQAQIKAQLFNRIVEVQGLKSEIEKTGDLSKLEDVVNNRHSLR